MQTQRSINLDHGWRFGAGSFNPVLDIVAQHFHAGDAPRIVDLPHDHMIESDVSAAAPPGRPAAFTPPGPLTTPAPSRSRPAGLGRRSTCSLTA